MKRREAVGRPALNEGGKRRRSGEGLGRLRTESSAGTDGGRQ